MRFVDLSGRVFGRWTVLRRTGSNSHGHPKYLCRCACGVERDVSSSNLVNCSTSCGCLRKETLTKLYRLRPYEALYRNFTRAATHPVELSFEDFLEFTKKPDCHYCKASVRWSKYTGQRGTPLSGYNLDRKDNNLGYSKDNVVVCCRRCNVGKSQFFTYDEWVQIGKLIQSWKK